MNEVINFVETLRRIHNDNGRVEHFARDPDRGSERSAMYLTPFVYAFFIYNGLYLFLAGLLTLFFNLMDKEKQSFQAE